MELEFSPAVRSSNHHQLQRPAAVAVEARTCFAAQAVLQDLQQYCSTLNCPVGCEIRTRSSVCIHCCRRQQRGKQLGQAQTCIKFEGRPHPAMFNPVFRPNDDPCAVDWFIPPCCSVTETIIGQNIAQLLYPLRFQPKMR